MNKKCETKMKSEGVKDVVKWLEKEIKKAKEDYDQAIKDRKNFGMYEDCGEYYHQNEAVAKAVLDKLVSVKISTEKYAKKLNHQENGR